MRSWSIVPAFVGYVVASLVGATTMLLWLGVSRAVQSGWSGWSDLFNLIAFFAIGTAIFAFVPSVIALVILRLARQTSWIAYLLAGIAVGLTVKLVILQRWERPAPTGVEIFGWEILMAGAVAGLAYWGVRRGLDRLTVLAKRA